jgi:DNA-binding protein Fis
VVESGLSDQEVEEAEPLSLAEMEKRYILKVLEDCGGNKAKAARILGIHASTIHRKLDEG